MEKILFLMKYPTCLHENLKNKFDGQMNACVRLGYEVWYLEWDGASFYAICKNTQTKEKVLSCKTIMGKTRYYHTQYFIDLYRAGCRLLKKEAFHYIYMRNMMFFPPAISMRNKTGSQTKWILEIPSYPFEAEWEAEKRVLRRLGLQISDHYRKKIFSKADMFVICGEPVKGLAYGKPAINVINGTDVENLPIRIPKGNKKEIHILLLASMCFWQAYDRMIEAMKEYKGKEAVKLHFVGNDGDGSLKIWKEMAENYGLTERIIFHGALYGRQLDEMVDQADIGIGTLGLYRKGSNEGATLKVREYMSRGLPFVYAGNDQAIAEGLEYVLQVPNDDTALDMEAIVAFAKKLKAAGKIPERMREYAREHMSWDSEFEKIFEKAGETG